MNTTSTTKFSRVMGISICSASAILACVIPQPASASPPTPREVARHVHNRVSGLFFKIARTLEGAPSDRREAERERERERYARERAYEEEYLYEEGYEREPSRPRDTGIRNPDHYHREDYVAPPPPVSRSRSDEVYGERGRDGSYVERNDTRTISPNSGGPDVSITNRGDDRPDRRTGPSSSSSTASSTAPNKTSASRTESSRTSNADKSSVTNRDGAASTGSNIGEKKAQYATPVPNKSGFVYPPGSKQTSENMLDVRGLEAGQKARDPRTGDVFLVP